MHVLDKACHKSVLNKWGECDISKHPLSWSTVWGSHSLLNRLEIRGELGSETNAQNSVGIFQGGRSSLCLTPQVS